VVQCDRQDVLSCPAASHYACRQVRESWWMKSGRPVPGWAQPVPARHGWHGSEDNSPSADLQSVTSLPAVTSPDLSSALRSSRQLRPSEIHATPTIRTTVYTSGGGGLA